MYKHVERQPLEPESMASTKTTTLTFRIDPDVKDALRTAAQQERRSLANMIDVMVLDYCQRHDIPVPPVGGLPGGHHRARSE